MQECAFRKLFQLMCGKTGFNTDEDAVNSCIDTMYHGGIVRCADLA